MNSAELIQGLQDGQFPIIQRFERATLFAQPPHEHPPCKLLIQSSIEPISPGNERLPFMETDDLRSFAKEYGFFRRPETPLEIYSYHWTNPEQTQMIFEVGFVVQNYVPEHARDRGYLVKESRALKMASVIYQGPFPHEAGSAFDQVKINERVKEQGLKATGKLYRELYHRYDFEQQQHIVEFQVEIE